MGRPHIDLTSAENNALWVASGGMCAKCKHQLILDDAGEKVNIGERAHIIGRGDKGPRRQYMAAYGYTEETLDDLTNLMLLCEPCHKTIDNNEMNYPPNMLFEMKRNHESFVAERLALNEKSVVVIHKRKGGPVDHISIAGQIDRLLLDSVALQDEFLDYTPEGWLEAKRQNETFYREVMNTKGKYDGATIALLALSPIPLLIDFGRLLSDTVPIDIYQYSRQDQVWVKDSTAPVEPQQEIVMHSDAKDGSTVLVVTVAISSAIRQTDIKAALEAELYDHLTIGVKEPKIDAVLFKSDCKNIKKAFQDTVLQLHQQHDYKEIHLLYAGPAGLAVELGRCINETMFPNVYLYHFNGRETPRYQMAFYI